MKANMILLLLGFFVLFSCTDESTTEQDVYNGGDVVLRDILSDTSGDTHFTDTTSDITSEDGSPVDGYICDIKCPNNMHCQNDQCVCDNNFADCNNDLTDGCEADLMSLKTCGSCTNDCSKPSLGADEFMCVNGECVVSKCSEGRADCNKKGNDGCEIYLTDDPKNCSKCGFDCGNNSVCNNGKCDCEKGYANCNMDLNDGCEQDISNDNSHCGGCNNKCGPNSSCSNQKCICSYGYEDCNGLNSDGCEIRIFEDKYHCGTCENDCTKLSGVSSAKCDTGTCVIIECQMGYGNCDNYNSNGCEANFSTDPHHCGDCATDCGNNSACNNKICGCKTDYANCDTNWSNGCEIFFNDDKTCGTTCQNIINCNSNAKCVNHSCQCVSPFANCNNLWDDGCEIDTSTDRLNCGTCKSTCIKINYSGTCINSKCAGRHAFSKAFGSTGEEEGVFVVTDSNNNIFLSANFSGSINLNGDIYTSKGENDIIIIKLNSYGEVLSAVSYGSTGYDAIQGMAIDKNGDILITGYYAGDIDFGGDIIKNTGDKDIFVLKLSNSLSYVWAQGFGSTGYDDGTAITVDSNLDVILTGRFSNTIEVDKYSFTSKGGADILLVKFNNNGDIVWAKAFGSNAVATNGEDAPTAMDVDESGNIYLTGYFAINENFGGDELVSRGKSDVFIAKFNSLGEHKKSISFGSTHTDLGMSIKHNSKGEIILSAIYYDNPIKVGAKEFPSKGKFDILVSKFDTNLNFIDAFSYGSTNDDIAMITVDKDDNIILSGYAGGVIKFGEEELTNRGGEDIVLVKLSSDLSHIFSYTFGSSGDDGGSMPATDSSGNIYITGYISGAVDFGGGDVLYVSLKDIFFAKFLP